MPAPPPPHPPRWLGFAVLLGLYLSLHGYQSREGDQAYRLPLLLHHQNPALYADDPFVQSFASFNPHFGYLVLLDGVSRVLGLSSALAGLYFLTYGLSCWGIDRLARSSWPAAGPRVGLLAMGLFLLARAGNIGTIHLFESMLLDRGIGFALGWVALAWVVDRPGSGCAIAAFLIGLAPLIHPSVGLQLAMLAVAGWAGWGLLGRFTGVTAAQSAQGVAWLALAVVPSLCLYAGQRERLFRGLPTDEFLLLSAYVQSPQHMLPHLWRTPQWLAWGCYPLLAVLELTGTRSSPRRGPWPAARTRLTILLGLVLIGLFVAWWSIEVMHDVRVIVFQPFRMATVARGLALIPLAGRILWLWERKDAEGRTRATLLALGLTGDWSMVVVTLAETTLTCLDAIQYRWTQYFSILVGCVKRTNPSAWTAPWCVARTLRRSNLTASTCLAKMAEQGGNVFETSRIARRAGAIVLVLGLVFLSKHDTESGHTRLIVGMAVLAAAALMRRGIASLRGSAHEDRAASTVPRGQSRPARRMAFALAIAWSVPLAAIAAPLLIRDERSSLVEALAARCRFGEVPVGDLERLAVWCRAHTPPGARFVGPPGPKTFRLWSRRSLAFNRAASPYHAEGLADWSARFRDHVGFRGSLAAFSRAYLDDRQSLERRYQAMTDAQRAALAIRQGATHVLAARPEPEAPPRPPGSPLRLLHVEGRYAAYLVEGDGQPQPQPQPDPDLALAPQGGSCHRDHRGHREIRE